MTNKKPITEGVLPCPDCNFTREAYEKFAKQVRHYTDRYEEYIPRIEWSSLLQQWVVYCQNCGMYVLFQVEDAETTLLIWNRLPRREHE